MLVSSASRSTVMPAMAAKPRRIRPTPGPRRRGRLSTGSVMSMAPRRAPSARPEMPRPGVAMHAAELLAGRSRAQEHGVDERVVAAPAVGLHDQPVLRRDLDRLLEVLERERHRVAEAMLGLGDPLREAVVGKMAVHAPGDVAMAALHPGVVLRV